MNSDLAVRASRAIEVLATRDGVSAEEIHEAIQDAIAQAQNNATPQSQLLWATMTPDGSLPLPEQLIAWVTTVVCGNGMADNFVETIFDKVKNGTVETGRNLA